MAKGVTNRRQRFGREGQVAFAPLAVHQGLSAVGEVGDDRNGPLGGACFAHRIEHGGLHCTGST